MARVDITNHFAQIYLLNTNLRNTRQRESDHTFLTISERVDIPAPIAKRELRSMETDSAERMNTVRSNRSYIDLQNFITSRIKIYSTQTQRRIIGTVLRQSEQIKKGFISKVSPNYYSLIKSTFIIKYQSTNNVVQDY